jgi:hypothetical protein
MSKNVAQVRDIERGEILRFLVEFYPAPVTPRMLLWHLDTSAYSVSEEALEFHIEYLAQKGFLTFEVEEKVVGQARRKVSVKATPLGIDRLDQRKKGEDGIRL